MYPDDLRDEGPQAGGQELMRPLTGDRPTRVYACVWLCRASAVRRVEGHDDGHPVLKLIRCAVRVHRDDGKGVELLSVGLAPPFPQAYKGAQTGYPRPMDAETLPIVVEPV